MFVPSLRVSTLQNSTNTNFAIRGFGNGANNVGIEPSVGVFVDGVYRSRSAGAISDLPTLERVEVLRGPQSTLFGKNASAGVINVVTAKPSGEFGGKISATVGNFDARVIKGELEGAISDTVAYKVSGGFNQRDGYIRNLGTGSEINDRDRYNVRGQLLFNPNDRTEIRVIADYDKIEELCCSSVNLVSGPATDAINAVGGSLVPNDPDALTTFASIDPFNEQENYGISFQLDYDFENFTVTSITSYREIDSFSNIDADFSSADLLTNDITTGIETFTTEIRLTSTAGNKFDWQVGAFYFDEQIDLENNLPFGAGLRPFVDLLAGAGVPGTLSATEGLLGVPAGGFFPAGEGVGEVATLDNDSFSLFGKFDYHFTDRFTASLGLNYTEDSKQASLTQVRSDLFSGIDLPGIGFLFAQLLAPDDIAAQIAVDPNQNPLLALAPLQFLPPAVSFPNAVEDGRTNDSELTYTLNLSYDINDAISVYGTYSTGFKASSFNLTRDSRPVASDIPALLAAGVPVANIPNGDGTFSLIPAAGGSRFADPEEAELFEIGLKARFARGSVNVAIFDQTIENFQSNNFNGTGFNLANAGEQSTLGAEIEITYFPIDAVKLTFAGTFLDPEFDSFEDAAIPNPATGGIGLVSSSLSGEQPSGINEVSISASAAYNFNIVSNEAYVQADFFYEDEVQVIDTVLASIASRETKILNVSGGIKTDSGYSVSLWARNLTDDASLISAFPSVAQLGSFSGYRTTPRTYGITLGKEF